MRKLLIVGFIMFILIFFSHQFLWTQEEMADIELLFEPNIIYETVVEIPVEIIYHKSLFNEEHFLSFHIYQGAELIQFENARNIIENIDDDIYRSSLKIDLSSDLYSNYKELIIKPDIVDQKNAIWLSHDEKITIKSSNVQYKNLRKMDVFEFLNYQFHQFGMVIIINIFVTVLVTIIGIKIYFREKENF